MIKRLGRILIDSPHINRFSNDGGIRILDQGVDDGSMIHPEQTNNLLRLTELIVYPDNHWERGLLLLFRNVRYHMDDAKEDKNGKLYPNCCHLVVKGTFWLHEGGTEEKFSLGDVFSHKVTRIHSVDTDRLCGTIILGYF
jgi:hypothetical protein